MKYFKAVVESGSCSIEPEPRRWEERTDCGHKHRSIKAAFDCLEKQHGRHYEKGSNTLVESALWYNGRVHDQDGRRVGYPYE